MTMGETKTRITLVNAMDFENAHAGLIKESEVRQVAVDAVVDTAAGPLVINAELCAKLGLRTMRHSTVGLAGGVRQNCAIASGLLIFWQDRYTMGLPLVLPEEKETLLGFIALEDMDLRVIPLEQKVEGAHGDQWIRYVR
jgi:predicted aspartyl protease